MRILNICVNGIYTEGYSYHENLLPKYHKKLGHDVYVLTSEYEFDRKGNTVICKNKNYVDKDGLHIIRLSIKGNYDINYKFKRFEHFYETIEQIEPDIIFCHLFQFIDVRYVVKYKKLNPKVILFLDSHSDFSNSASTWFSKIILHKIIWKYYAHMALPYTIRFYGVLPARVDFITNMYKIPKDKVELLIMGADDELVESAAKPEAINDLRNRYSIRKDDFLIVTGGKIDTWKTQTLLLMDAVNSIENSKLKLIVFGSVSNELKEEFKTKCSERVKYGGWIESMESYFYFAASDLVVFPGRHSVFWEQVAGQGIPMIQKHWNGTTHIKRKENVVFLYNDSVKEIRDNLSDLINNPEKLKLMKEDAWKCREDFLYSRLAKQSLMIDDNEP